MLYLAILRELASCWLVDGTGIVRISCASCSQSPPSRAPKRGFGFHHSGFYSSYFVLKKALHRVSDVELAAISDSTVCSLSSITAGVVVAISES